MPIDFEPLEKPKIDFQPINDTSVATIDFQPEPKKKKGFGQFLLEPISKQITGKSLGERTDFLNKASADIVRKSTKPISVGEAFIRQLPAAIGQAGVNLVDLSPLDVGIMAATGGAGKIPIKGTTLGEIAKTIPVGKGFVKNVKELGRYEKTLKTITPLSSRGVPKVVTPEVSPVTIEKVIKPEITPTGEGKVTPIGENIYGEPTTKLGNYISTKLGIKYDKIKLVAEYSKDIGERRDARKILRIISDKIEEPYKIEKLAEFQPESDLFKKATLSTPTGQKPPIVSPKIAVSGLPEPKTPDFAENINLTKYPKDVRQTIHELVTQKPELGKTPTISDAELIKRASELKDTPTIKYLSTLPEGTVETEALKVRQGNTEGIREALKLPLNELGNKLNNEITQGIELHRKTAAMFGRGLRQQRLPAETQQQMAFAIDDTIKRISKDPVFGKDQELIDAIKKLRSVVVEKEFNPTLWNKIYFTWMNSILSNPFTHAVNTASNTYMALSKIPEKFASAIWDLPLALKTGKRTQFFGEIPAMIKGLASKGKLPQELAYGSKLDIAGSPIRGVAGKIIGFPTKLLQAEDNLAKTMVGKMELYAQRYAGKTGEALTKAVNEEQLYRTFQNDVGVVGNSLLVLKNRIPLLRYVIPFIKTPENLIARGLERTPLGAIKIARKAIAKTYTQETLAKDLGNLTLGTIGAGWVGLQWAKGNMTGRVPSDQAQRDAFYRQGKKPNAIKIGNKWIPFERLEPLGTSMATMVNMIQDYKQSDKENPAEKTLEAFTKLGSTLTNKSYLSGFTGMINALSGPERYGQSFLTRIATGVEPQLLKFFADLKDPYYREANSILDQFKAKTPFISETLPPKLNVFGEPVKRDFLNIGKVNQEPLESMIAETPVSFPSKILGREKLTPEEYRWLLKTSGGQLKEMLLKISPDKFMQLPLEIRESIINKLESKTRTLPRGILRAKKLISKSRIDFQPVE